MQADLKILKAELERFGEENDSAHTERSQRMLNITRDTGEFLSVMVRAMAARHVLEIGTSNGYSTLWLAEAASSLDGLVMTVERSATKAKMAAHNFSRSGLTEQIRMIQDEAGRVLEQTEDTSVDLLFLDSERSEYVGWWQQLRRVLRPGGLLIVDNALSHQRELAPFIDLVATDPQFTTSLVPVGKGEFLTVKDA